MTPAGLVDALAEPLRGWLPEQRWFAGKGRPVDAVELQSAVWLAEGDPGLAHATVTVRQGEDTEIYQLLIGVASDPPEHCAPIGEVDGLGAFEGTADPELAGVLLDLFAAHAWHGDVVFAPELGVDLETELPARGIGAEQSNTSVVFGETYILKLYRRPHPGPQRDLDLHRALRTMGSLHVAEPLGCIYAGDTVLGFLQRFLPDAAEGWAAACASVRDLMAEGDLHADEVGGDFAGEAHRLGVAVATVHADLARSMGSDAASAEQKATMVRSMHERLDRVLGIVPEVGEHADAVRAAFDELVEAPVVLQQVHGDLHLGQVLRTTAGWVLIDFEGEPAATLADRGARGSPLRDVAGMLRSFDYVAHHLLAERGGHQLEVRAQEWSERNRAAFCDGYAELGGDSQDPREHKAALQAFELDKAVYEVGYEQQNRPSWVSIPMAALHRLGG